MTDIQSYEQRVSDDSPTRGAKTQPPNEPRFSKHSPPFAVKTGGSTDESSSPEPACTATSYNATKTSQPSSTKPPAASGPTIIPARKTASRPRVCALNWQRPNTTTENCSRKCRSSNAGSEHKDHRLVQPYSINIPSSSNSESA